MSETRKALPEPVAWMNVKYGTLFGALPPLPACQGFSLTQSVYTADDMRDYARAALAAQAEKIAHLESENFSWRTKLGIRGYEKRIADLQAERDALRTERDALKAGEKP